jgi:hypothetical protein
MWWVFAAAVVSFGFGFAIGYRSGRGIGYMVGEELERRKWKRRTFS